MFLSIFLYGLIGLMLLLLVYLGLDFRRKQRAASNVVFAKYTYSQLNKPQKKKVHERAIELVLGSGTRTRGFANDVERYGWYAMAMRDMGIHSAVPDNPVWHKIKNPYTAITPGHYFLGLITGYLEKNYQLTISISKARMESRNPTSDRDSVKEQ